MKPKNKKKLTLSKHSISNLTDVKSNGIQGGANWTNTLTTLTSLFEQTCRCSWPPKCGSDMVI
jgi:hypothetical protein